MRRLSIWFLTLACLLSLTACGEAGKEDNPDALTLFDCGGLQAALPSKYLDRLYIEQDFPDAEESWKPLLSVYEKASYEAARAEYGESGGFLFGLLSMDQAAFEQMIGEDAPGIDVFASDGQRYYAYTYPTDVQFFRPGGEIDTESDDWTSWEELNEIGPSVREDFLTRNHLQTFSIQDLASQPFTVDESHVCLLYYPSFLLDGDKTLYLQLLLSQPARQGTGGVWAVERWLDCDGSQTLYFPDTGKPAAEHYAQLQEECDAGAHPELLTPEGAAIAFVHDAFGSLLAVEDCFARVPEIDQDYIDCNLYLNDFAAALAWGEPMDPLVLLDCIGRASGDNLRILESRQKEETIALLLDAVRDDAVGDDQQDRDRDVMAFYLAAQETDSSLWTPVAEILQAQMQAAPEAFMTALDTFSGEDRALLEDAVGISARLVSSVAP